MEYKIASISPLLLDGFLIIVLDSKWVGIFQKIPSFDVSIIDSRLIISSQELVKPVIDKNISEV